VYTLYENPTIAEKNCEHTEKKRIKSCLLLRRFLLYRKISHMQDVKTVNTLLPEAPFMLNEEIKSIVHVYTSIVC